LGRGGLSTPRLPAAPARAGGAFRRRALVSTPLLGLAAVIGLAAGLRLHELGARSLWIDELFSVGLAVQDLRTTLAVLYGEEANMALYYAIMHLWLGLVGAAPSEVLARLPSVVFGLASLWALYLVGTELDHPLSGLLAALLGAVNAYHVGMSQEARAYTLWALCAALAWLALLRALGGGGRPAWAAYALTTALALYSHFFTVFIVFAQIVFVGLRGRWSELRALALSAMGAAALCLPFVPFFVLSHEGSQILHVRPNAPRDLLDLFRLYAGGSTLLLGAYIVLGGLGVAVGWLGSGDWRGRVRRGAPVFWLLVPVVTAFLVSYVKPVFKERYLFAAMPAFPLLAGLGLAAIHPRPLGLAVALATLALSAGPLSGGINTRQEENWRAATQYLLASSRESDGWIFISKRGQLGYEYYAGWLAGDQSTRPDLDVLEGFDWRELANAAAYRPTTSTYRALESGTAGLSDFGARHSRIWLVLAHEFDAVSGGDTSTAVRDWLIRHGYSAQQHTFQGIRVLLYERAVS